MNIGSYWIVNDTCVENLEAEDINYRPWGEKNNPITSVKESFPNNPSLEIDKDIDNKLIITVAPLG